MKKIEIIVFVVFCALSELALKFSQDIGFGFYFVLISTVLIILSRAKKFDEDSKLLIILLILPMYRISSMFLYLDQFWDIFISYTILLFLAIFYLYEFKINPGFNDKGWNIAGFAIAIGALAGFLSNNWFNLSLGKNYVLVLLIISLSEELVLRGLIFQQTESLHGKIYAILISSLLYGVFSLGFGIGFALLAFGFSLIVGWMYSTKRNIYLTIAANLTFHLVILLG